MRGYIYKLVLSKEELDGFIKKHLRNPIFIPEDVNYYEPISNIPSDFKLKGRAFSEEGEIRWKRLTDEYEVLLLTEEDKMDLKGRLVSDCEARESKDIYLLSLKDKSINPKFDSYPGNDVKKIKIYIYSKDGIPLTLRIRGLIR